MTTLISPGAEARAGLIVAAERLWNTHGLPAFQALQAGEIEVAAEVERDWP